MKATFLLSLILLAAAVGVASGSSAEPTALGMVCQIKELPEQEDASQSAEGAVKALKTAISSRDHARDTLCRAEATLNGDQAISKDFRPLLTLFGARLVKLDKEIVDHSKNLLKKDAVDTDEYVINDKQEAAALARDIDVLSDALGARSDFEIGMRKIVSVSTETSQCIFCDLFENNIRSKLSSNEGIIRKYIDKAISKNGEVSTDLAKTLKSAKSEMAASSLGAEKIKGYAQLEYIFIIFLAGLSGALLGLLIGPVRRPKKQLRGDAAQQDIETTDHPLREPDSNVSPPGLTPETRQGEGASDMDVAGDAAGESAHFGEAVDLEQATPAPAESVAPAPTEPEPADEKPGDTGFEQSELIDVAKLDEIETPQQDNGHSDNFLARWTPSNGAVEPSADSPPAAQSGAARTQGASRKPPNARNKANPSSATSPTSNPALPSQPSYSRDPAAKYAGEVGAKMHLTAPEVTSLIEVVNLASGGDAAAKALFDYLGLCLARGSLKDQPLTMRWIAAEPELQNFLEACFPGDNPRLILPRKNSKVESGKMIDVSNLTTGDSDRVRVVVLPGYSRGSFTRPATIESGGAR